MSNAVHPLLTMHPLLPSLGNLLAPPPLAARQAA
jgi:hypothetical protein